MERTLGLPLKYVNMVYVEIKRTEVNLYLLVSYTECCLHFPLTFTVKYPRFICYTNPDQKITLKMMVFNSNKFLNLSAYKN